MSNPYRLLFETIATRLVDAAGPFAHPSQVEYWQEAAIDEIAPDERLVSALCKDRPQALLSLAGGVPGESLGGQTEFSKKVRVAIRFGCRGPHNAPPLLGDGGAGDGSYWGVLETLHWIETRICLYGLTAGGAEWDPLEYAGDDAIPTSVRGEFAHKLTVLAPFIVTTV